MHVAAFEPSDEARLSAFLSLPREMAAGDARFVEPLRQPILAELTGRTAWAKSGRLQCFLAEDGSGKALGRAVALLNRALVDASGAPIGMVGYFECEDDVEVARALFDAANLRLRGAGATETWGPMNGGVEKPHRLMVSGFQRDPVLLEPRNPAYYPRLFEASGFTPFHRWYGFDMPRTELEKIHALLSAGTRRAEASGQYGIELLDPREQARTLARLHPLLDGVWAGHTGYVPLSFEAFAEMFGGVLAVITERHIGVLVDRKAGRDVGCAFMVPDWIAEARALSGDASGWGSWLEKAPQPKTLILHTVAVLPEVRRMGAPMLLVARGIQHMIEDGFEELHLALVDETFRIFQKIARPTREYALYRKGLV